MSRLSTTSIGACVTLSELIRNHAILPPVLAQVARGIAGPAVRSSATVGGNMLLSGRCRFLNESALSREARGPCMKAGGTGCLVVDQDKSCYAISSGDLVPNMLALGASFRLAGPDGERVVAASDFFLPDGIQANTLKASELLTEVLLPNDVFDLSAGYIKLSSRSAIDFPEAGVAVALKCSTDHEGRGRIAFLRVSMGALGPCPIVLTLDDGLLLDSTPADLTEKIWKKLSPKMHAVRNGSFRPGYRKALAKKYLGDLLERITATPPPHKRYSSSKNEISS